MLSYEEARNVILESLQAPGTETIPVRKALGRVLAADLTVPRDFPDTRRSAVDGYAVRFGGGSEFAQVAVLAAGDVPRFALEPGQCAAVMTGGTVPKGTDCVVMVEHCEERNGVVEVLTGMESGAFINEPAGEAASGEMLLESGRSIRRAVYPALFCAGISRVEVYRRLRAGVLVTGGELREVEDGPERGKVFNTNLYILESFLDSIGVGIDLKLHVPDDEAVTRNGLEDLAGECDFIISSGGVSKGRYDYVKRIFREADFSLLVEGTAIKPGSPLMVAKRGGRIFFGMPGYPAAFLTNAVLYLIPALKKAGGLKNFDHRWIEAKLTTPMHSRMGKLYFNRAVLELKGGLWTARDPGSQKTSHFLNFAVVNGLVLLPETVGDLEAGSTVQALHLDLELGY